MKKLIVALTFVFLMTSPLYAYTQESAKANAHYAHPETGIIEDSGNNIGIGQGMCQNILHESALFEEIDGQVYLCVRYHLIDNIDKVEFAVQNKGEESFTKQNYEVVSETKETRDYRFKVPSKNIVVRSKFFVNAMGRDVVFYFDFSDFVNGNTDFKALGENGKMEASKGSEEEGEKIVVQGINQNLGSGNLGYDHGLLMKDSPEIQRILKEGNGKDVDSDREDLKERGGQGLEKNLKNQALPKGGDEWSFVSKTLFQGFVLFVVLLTFFTLTIAIAIYFLAKHVKHLNSIREAVLYEED